MKLNLYPYNMYILYAALFLLLVCIIMTLMRLLSMAKVLGDLQAETETLSRNAAVVGEELQKQSEKKKASRISLKKILAGWLLLSAVKKDYDRHEENGMRQAVRSYRNVTEARALKKLLSEKK